MGRSKNHTEAFIGPLRHDVLTSAWLADRYSATPPRIHIPKKSCKDHFSVLEPQINAQGVHKWPFDEFCPVDVVFFTGDDRQRLRMNRHEYFEVSYLCSGSADYHIQDRLLPWREGDLAVVGSTVYHRIEWRSSSPVTIAGLFFEPDMIRCDGASDSAEYLTPFFLQDSEFPHIVPAESGVPRQVLELMLRLRVGTAGLLAQGTAYGEGVFKDASRPAGKPIRLLCRKGRDVPAPAGRSRPAAQALPLSGRELRRADSGSGSCTDLRNERVVLYELLQTGHWLAVHEISHPLSHRTGANPAGQHR